jgi:phosphoglycerol transferase MdoB-like AlkP superfamily enzyme
MALVDIAAQTVRITGDVSGLDTTFLSAAYFSQISSTVFYYVAVIVFWVGAFSIVRRPVSRRLLAVAFHVYFVLQSVFIILTALYFMLLDVMVNEESFQLVRLIFQVEMFKIIRAEVKAFIPLLGLAVVIIANFLPVIVNRKWTPRWLHRAPTDHRRLVTSRAVVLTTFIAVVASLAISALPDGTGSTNFTRNRALGIGLNAARDNLAGPPPGFTEPTRADLPLDTRLVPTKRTKKYNVVQLMLESEGWQSTTLGTPSRPTTPVLADLAKHSLVATQAYTGLPHTSKALVTTNCGFPPPLDTANTEAEPGGLAAKCLPRLLGEQGYATGFFQTATREFENRAKVVDAFGYQDFYAEEDYSAAARKKFSTVNTLGYEDDLGLEPMVDWATSQADAGKPFSLQFMTVTAHTKYVLPQGFPVKRYVDDEAQNNYLNAVRYQDEWVGKVIKEFKAAGLYDNTIFVIMGDHGEGFREHGRRLHNDTIWAEGTHIPLIITAPDRWKNGATQDRPVMNTDVLPTIADLLGYDIKGGRYPAWSILDDSPSPYPRMTSCWDVDQCIASYSRDGYKYIYFFGYRQPEYYDMSRDPRDEHDLWDTLSSAKKEKLKNEVLLWQAETNAAYGLSRTLAGK